ncbi:copper resistance protein CopC [Tumebacillus sp. ITR2]|uniref:Copper resistance protein CopC n=1 Tax=Tumebacillus amylolyticus TaxID=2801339 RepID=A0ABS1JA92_9BACL|nr:copper resistance protein CopC [Tumebacillus amylolyticus]MBL0387197.1 copper resistance protein CopC [Tumebacillus amylolyticus]
MKKLRPFGFALILLFLFAWQAQPVFAHANLIKTSPFNGGVVATSPERVTLEFNEPLEPDLIGLKLYDWNGKQLSLEKPHVTSGKPTEMQSPLPQLEQGTYTVAWSVISEDGHPVNGSISFSIGTRSADIVGPTKASQLFQHGFEILLIVLRYAVEGIVLLAAGFYGLAFVARRFQLPSVDALLTSKVRTLMWGLLFLLTIGEWFVYSAGLPGGGMNAALLQGHWNIVFESPFATMLLLQAVLLLLFALRGMQSVWYPLIGALLVANFAFGGHARGITPEWLGLSLRVLHLLVIALWLGGLSYLGLTLRHEQLTEETLDRTKFRPFFVRTMAVAAILTTITGIAMTEVQTDWFSVLLFKGGMWGNLLWLKVGFLVIMLVLAWFQTMRWRDSDRKLNFDLLRTEWLVGILVIQVAVFLSQMPYPSPVHPYRETLQAQQMQAEVRIPKLVLGEQTLSVTLPQAPQEVKATLKMMDMEMGDLDLKPVKKDATHYDIPVPFVMSGHWKFTITAVYPDDKRISWSDEVLIPQGGQL